MTISSIANSESGSSVRTKLNSVITETNTFTNTGIVASTGVTTIWHGTQVAYDALSPDANTLYFIQG